MAEFRRVVRLGLTGAMLAMVIGLIAGCDDATGPDMSDEDIPANCTVVDGVMYCW